MNYKTIFSGSKGNASVLRWSKKTVLIDCGVNCKTLENALVKADVLPTEVDAIFVTHEHSDHICGVSTFVGKYNKPVYVHEKNVDMLLLKTGIPASKIKSFDDKSFAFDEVLVSTLKLSHDANHCCAYKFEHKKQSMAIATDFGKVEDAFFDFVRNCKLLVLESNHDLSMLTNGKYPAYLKRRIASELGHLSNDQAGQVLARLPNLNVSEVLLGHLSQENNTTEMAFSTACSNLRANGIQEGKDIFVDIAMQFCASEMKMI